MKARPKAATRSNPQGLTWIAAFAGTLLAASATAQTGPDYPVTPQQRSTAQQVAQAGVPLSELAPNAPDTYVVKRGDTLWDISSLFLRRPWRWPELWGMNLQQIRNPHLIYPGQRLTLERVGGMARLRVGPSEGMPTETIRVSPRSRMQPLADMALPTLKASLIEPFLSEPVIVDEGTLFNAPRIVSAVENRVLITRGDRAYARGPANAPLKESANEAGDRYRVFRNVIPLRDPVTGAVLGYEAAYLGRAELVRGESEELIRTANGKTQPLPVPASLNILAAREEMRAGDRLLPEPPRQLVNYVPHAPSAPLQDAAVVHIYGDAVGLAGQNQVVVLNKGTVDGMEVGHVVRLLRGGQRVLDRSQPGEREQIKLPDERNGLMMVFRVFDRLSYALVLETNEGVRVGDRVVNPR